MGIQTTRTSFGSNDYQAFSDRLRQSLEALQALLERPDFGRGDATLGAELEVNIIDEAGRALPITGQVLTPESDPHINPEVNQFNLEFNLDPVPLRGAPFTRLKEQIEAAMGQMNRLVAPHGGSVCAIGILPSLGRDDLRTEHLTDLPRYNVLAHSLHKHRQAPFQINIRGEEHLLTVSNSVALEGANTSLQLHLRVDPDGFADTFNAAQMVTPLALAVAANSPYFLDHRLWDETRIALFKQSVDSRSTEPVAWRRAARVPFGHGWVRRSVLEQFAEAVLLFEPMLPDCSDQDPMAELAAGRMPSLSELRLHQGTIWQWNRAVFDPAAGGHLRIEFRALPAGPTPLDMAANAAFLLGATAGWAPRMGALLPGFPFHYAEYNFYRAASRGLDARLLWPSATPLSPRERPATELVRECLPVAAEGLARLGVDPEEARTLLAVIEQRCERGINPARWQSARVRALEGALPRPEALRTMLLQYCKEADSGRPLHQWPGLPA